MKKTLSLIIAAIIIASVGLSLVSCSDGNSGKTLYVYNWGEYISDGSEDSIDVNAAFEEYYFETYGETISVNYSTYSSNEDLYAKIKSGAANYDVIIPSDYMIERLISENLITKLDFTNIPNYQYIDDNFKGSNTYYDPENLYSVPYFYGMVGVIYNTDLISAGEPDIGSWSLMWDSDYSGNILQFNNPRDALGTAMYYLGYDVNEATETEWRGALDKLKEQKSIVQGYVMDEIFNKMKSGSAAVAAYYAGDFLSMYESNDKLAFYYPKEGTNIFVDAMCVPTTSENKIIAERYIDFMLSEEIATANAEYTYYASPNTLVTSSQEYKDYITSVNPDAMEILYSSAKAVPTSFFKNLSDEKLEMINSLWEELKIESSSIGSAVYIGCGVIILIIAGFITFKVIQKKKRSNYD